MKNIVIVGGGTGGIFTAALLKRQRPNLAITLLEPAEVHYYQPLWTLVGGGEARKEKSARPMKDQIPDGVKWIREAASAVRPDAKKVVTAGGDEIPYDALVLAPGIQVNWDRVEGLKGSVGRNGIVSIYGYEDCQKTFEELSRFKGGTALFTMPSTPIKCAGAPQKIAYLADDIFRRNGVREKSKIIYTTGGAKIFGVKEFAATLEKVVARRGIDARFCWDLKSVDAVARKATFAVTLKDGDNVIGTKSETIGYDLLHVVPPMSAPDWVAKSGLAAAGDTLGWIEVDQHALQHKRYPDIFALGDASSAPTSRTGAAIRREAPVLVHNLIAHLDGVPAGDGWQKYDGYAACPLITGFGKLVMAEFDYTMKPRPSFPFDTTQERWSMYQLKKYGLPFIYWNFMMKGRTF